jgi:hypothetical protein
MENAKIVSLPDYAKALEKAKRARLDQAIMDRAKHLTKATKTP